MNACNGPYTQLVKAYDTAFSTIDARFPHVRALTADDKPHLDGIRRHAAYALGRPFSYIYDRRNPHVFKATEYEIETYNSILPFLAAHEICHALSRKRCRAGAYNTKTIRFMYPTLKDRVAKKANDLCEAAEFGSDETNLAAEHAQHEFDAWAGLWVALDKEYKSSFKAEEYACDAFALQVFPGADLNCFERFLYDNKKDVTVIGPLPATPGFDTHPSARSRLHRLRMRQRY